MNCKTDVYLHRFLMNCSDDIEVDHINHDPLDNRKSNLRYATSTEQKYNTKIRSDNISGERGIYYDKNRNTWNVSLRGGNKKIFKRFKSKSEAVYFRDEVIKEMHKDFLYVG